VAGSSWAASRIAASSSGVTTSCGACAPSRDEKLAGSSSGPLTCRLTSPFPATALVTSLCAQAPACAPATFATANRLGSRIAGVAASSAKAGTVRTCRLSIVGR